MNSKISILAILLCIGIAVPLSAQKKLISLVNPFIGTGGHGHTFPGSTYPFGACQLSPDTRLEGWDGCSGYHYSDSIIYGFSHTHLSGTGCSDYGDILLMPVTKEMPLDHYQYASSFSHLQEEAHPGYYAVQLASSGIEVELTSTLHGGVHLYHYPQGADPLIVLDLKHRDEVLDSHVEKVDDYTLRGYRFSKAWASNQKVYFEIKFSEPIEQILYEPLRGGSSTTPMATEKSQHCLIRFAKRQNNQNDVMVKVSISGVDEEGAHQNGVAEMKSDDFYWYKKKAEQSWETELGKLKVKPAQQMADSHNQLVIFYTALYHSMIHPSLYSDVDGRYRGRDDRIHSTEGKFRYYTVFSLWDTYRALHPLLNIIDPERTRDFVNTFIREYEEGGRLPIWELSSNETNCMIGYHVVSVIWDAYVHGIRDFDQEKAFEAMKSIATSEDDYHYVTDIANNPSPSKEAEPPVLHMKAEARSRCADADALESYCRFGFVRSDDAHESVSKTLEFSFNDWCIAQMAQHLGKEKEYQYYVKRSHAWMNVYDPSTGFMRARKNGCLYQPFSPYTVDNNYTEANSWQYSFYVPHAIDELMKMHGGKDSFAHALDALFAAKTKTEGREQADITGLIGQYAHGNEPSHEIAYLYRYAGQPEKTQVIIDRILDSFYTNTPEGLIGNEDCGQMSAWYVMSSLGRYAVCPGKPDYEEISPRFITHSEAWANAGILEEETANGKTNKPAPFTPNPSIAACPRIFKNNMTLKFQPVTTPDSMYSYRIFASVNHGAWMNADAFTNKNFTESFAVKFQAKSFVRNSATKEEEVSASPIQEAVFTQLPNDREIILRSEYNKSYHANGAEGLMDGIYGKTSWRSGDWQGYQGQDVEVIMAFKAPKEIHSIGANFLEDQNAWIFYPKEVDFYTSDDMNNWTLVKEIPTHKSDHDLTVSISNFNTTCERKARYVKMIAKNFGEMPQWHEGRGFPTFIFIDELEVK